VNVGMSVLRLARTLRWLRPEQLVGQVAHRVRRAVERPESFAARPAPPDPGPRAVPRGAFVAPGAQRLRADALRAGRFEFLNRSEVLGWPPRWDVRELPKLWAYNLHYFEYLFALPYEEARELALDWIARHPLRRAQVGWEPYPLSLRLGVWCRYFLGLHAQRLAADAELRAALWRSMQLQADWLASHLETHILGNHLLENGAALALVGACFQGAQADRWLAQGDAVLAQELPVQVLPDGGHFERSPMYHARTVWLLDALAKSGCKPLASRVGPVLERLRAALPHLCHPDGEIALLNDSVFGVANPPAELYAPAAAGPFALADTGYFGARGDDGHYVVCDAAPIGPDYLPGHAHGDLLAFELSLRGRRVIVDSGVSSYVPGEARAYARSTRAHNTVEIDGQDQCEFWSAFRVARRGRPHDVRFEACGGGFRLSAWHDGYERLPVRARHRRHFRWHPQGVLLVRDEVEARAAVRAVSRLHLHPDCEAVLEGTRQARIAHPGGAFRVAFAGPGELRLEPSQYAPELGLSIPSRALAFSSAAPAVTGFCVADGDAPLAFELETGARVGGTAYAF
jgi:uncharacterized heparinase superfamily protein